MPTNSVSLNGDYATQLAQLQQRQKMAQMLQEQAAAPIEVQSYKGIQAPISNLSILAKALQGFGGAYLSNQATKDAGALQQKANQQYGTDIAEALGNVKIPESTTPTGNMTLNVPGTGQAPAPSNFGQQFANPLGNASVPPPADMSKIINAAPIQATVPGAPAAPSFDTLPAAPVGASPGMLVPQSVKAIGAMPPIQATAPVPPQGPQDAMMKPLAAPGTQIDTGAQWGTTNPATERAPNGTELIQLGQKMISSTIPGEKEFGLKLIQQGHDKNTNETIMNSMMSAGLPQGADPVIVKSILADPNSGPSALRDYYIKVGENKQTADAKAQELLVRLNESKTPDEKNYGFAVKQGYNGSFQDYLAQQATQKRSPTSVKIDMGKTIGSDLSQVAASNFAASAGAASNAQISLEASDQIRKALAEPGGIFSGPLANQKVKLTQLFNSKDPEAQQKLNNTRTAITSFALKSVEAASMMAKQGAISNNERDLLAKAASGSISDMTPGEINTVLNISDKVNKYTIEMHNRRSVAFKKAITTNDPSNLVDFFNVGTVNSGENNNMAPGEYVQPNSVKPGAGKTKTGATVSHW